jgi:hypothetical protein
MFTQLGFGGAGDAIATGVVVVALLALALSAVSSRPVVA